LVVAPAWAEEGGDPQPKQDPRWQTFYQSEAGQYQFETTGDAGGKRLELQPQPVMHWVSLNDFNGDVFVWTREGRPEVLGTVFSFPARTAGERNVLHEFHSLSEESIEAAGPGGRSFSFPRRSDLKAIPGAPAPAAGAARRRLQARALAREFSAHMKRQDQRWELRLLNQPLYSYGETSGDVLGGAVFAFVGFVTDPEILLLIEARKTDTGSEWRYGAARFSDKSLWLNRKGAEVWRFLADAPPADAPPADAPYYLSPPKTVGIPADD
jgi:hypothetical protein